MQLRTSKIFHVMLYQQKREADTSLENTRFAREHNRFCERTQQVLRENANIFARERQSFEKNAILPPRICSIHPDFFPPPSPLKGSVEAHIDLHKLKS